LIDNGGACTRRQLAIALPMQDESQIEYYEKRLREMPLPVLKKRGVISETNVVVRLEVDKLSLQERASIRPRMRFPDPEIGGTGHDLFFS
jgi:ATP adenylyltransferase